MSATSSNLKFIFGIVLISCGWIICFDIFLLFIGLGLFLLGTILVLVSKKSIFVKLLTIGLPIILWFVGFEIILYQINKKTPITLLIPEKYAGQIRIVYGEKNGILPRKEKDRMVLVIPQNGVLIIQPFLESGLKDFEFYYADSIGQRKQIEELKTEHDHGAKYPIVLYQGVFSSAGPPGQSADLPVALDYNYESFYVYPPYSPDIINRLEPTDPSSFTEEAKNNPLNDSLVKVSRRIK